MRKFKVNVNGSVYEVEVEEISGVPAAAPAPVQAASAPAAAAAPVQTAPAAPAQAAAGQETVASPLPGNILDVKVSVGSKVKKGDILLIIEAMKMENEVRAGRDGTIVAVNVAKGATVNSGDTLLIIG